MNIVLINPPFFEVYRGFGKAARIGASYPPTGLLYLAGKLEADGHAVSIIDVDIEGYGLDELVQAVAGRDPGLVGITATTPTFRKAGSIARAVKAAAEVPVVIGGIHVTILGAASLKDHPEFDYAVIGEGEITLSELAGCLENGRDPAGIAGLVINRNGTTVAGPSRPLLENLDTLPLPARNLVARDAYLWTPPGKGVVPIASVITQRGCPFDCAFCSQHSMFSRRVRSRSVGNVLDELEVITEEHGIRHVMILDDTFVLDRERTLRICDGIRQRGLRFTWENMSRADLIDREVIQAMAGAGLVRMSFGIESGDQRILDRIHKGTTLQQIRDAYRWADEAGIETRGSAILGHPGETSESAWRTIRFLRSIKELKQVYINIMVPYPGTEVHELALRGEAGYRLLERDFDSYLRYQNSVLEVNDLSSEKLKKLQKIGLWYFYLSPGRIWYNLFRSGIKNGLVMAFAMLRGLLSSEKGAR